MNYHFMNKNPSYSKHKIGRYTYGDPRIEGDTGNPSIILQIGSFCSIARGVSIWLGGNHHNEWVSTSVLNDYLVYDGGGSRHRFDQISSDGSVIIGNDVWMGVDVTVLSGVKIGDGATIGMKAVVSKDVPPYCVAVGNLAKVVKKRFTDEQIQKLLDIKWWNWDDAKIKINIPMILSPNVDDFITQHYKK